MSGGRTRYLVSYDISDPKRLRRVHKAIKAFGWPMQYSIFICDLDAVEMLVLKQEGGGHHSSRTGFCRIHQPRTPREPRPRVFRLHGDPNSASDIRSDRHLMRALG